MVLNSANGRWQQSAPYILGPQPCADGIDVDIKTYQWSLVPRSDGTMSGVSTAAVATDECGMKGTVVKTPFMGERTGDVPPTVVLADPALFVS